MLFSPILITHKKEYSDDECNNNPKKATME